MMNIKCNKTGTILDIAPEGIFDTKTSPELMKVITENISDATEVNFDLAGLEFLTSAGLRALLAARQEMDDRDGTMTIKNVSDDIMKIFKMTGFADILTIL
jgi:anti-anti-sigma factor